MRLQQSLICALTLALMTLSMVPSCIAQDSDSCDPTREVAICFPPKPFDFDRCNNTLLGHFKVQHSGSDAYKFKYQLLQDGKVASPIISSGDEYLLTAADATSQTGTLLTQKFQGQGAYSLRVTVDIEHHAPISLTSSPQIFTADKPHVRALTVGISKYQRGGMNDDSDLPNLSFADEDAKSFGNLLASVFPGLHDDLLTSTDHPDRLAIQSKIDEAASDPQFCAAQDWYFFYFSGHGIVDDSNQSVRHFISTWSLDPANIPDTAIWIKQLILSIENIRAGNKVIVLDSCFSGRNNAPSSAEVDGSSASIPKGTSKPKNFKPTYKIAYVRGQHFVKSIDLGNQGDDSGDSALAEQDLMSQETAEHKRALFIVASGADHIAEEGVLCWDPSSSHINASLTQCAPTGAGHGFLTFNLIDNFESQIPSRFILPEILLTTTKPHFESSVCQMDFTLAGQDAKTDLSSLEKQGRDTQRPEVNQTKDAPPKISCDYLPIKSVQ